jgi:hypothetical protein
MVLDQFSRNVWRDTPRAFSQDGMALVLAQELVATGQDRALSPAQRAFAYMPYMHSESPPSTSSRCSSSRSQGWRATCASHCSTRPSSSALAATRTATPCWGGLHAARSWRSWRAGLVVLTSAPVPALAP